MGQFLLLKPHEVIAIHDAVIGKNELQGLAKDKSLEATLERVFNRVMYGFITDEFELAACYATFLARGHCFQDANKRTAMAILYLVLNIHQIDIKFKTNEVGDWIIKVAVGASDEKDLAQWLRNLSQEISKS